MITKHEQRLRLAAYCVRETYKVTEATCPDVTTELSICELEEAKVLANGALEALEECIDNHRWSRRGSRRFRYARVARVP